MRRPVVAALAAVVAALGFFPPAAADTAPDPGTMPPTGQRREADALAGLAASQRERLNRATAEVDRLAGVLARARAAEAAALRRQQDALAAAAERQAAADAAGDAAEHQRLTLGAWASDAYQTGLADPHVRDLATVLDSADPDQALNRMALLDTVGRVQDRAVTGADHRRTTRAAAQAQAERYKDRAMVAARQAQRQRDLAARTLAAQKRQVTAMSALWRTAQDRAGAADRAAWAAEDTIRVQRARVYAAADTAVVQRVAPGGPNVTSGPTGRCRGADISGYGNGRIPVSALCPLFVAPGQYLRADAAYEFGLMSRSYAAEFGTPICVTEGYRTLAEQVELRITRPGLSATPGYSNHGWALATDLCGGINRFGTPQHAWMLAHAGEFGWYHPSWAEPNGRLPEAWHWQFRWATG